MHINLAVVIHRNTQTDGAPASCIDESDRMTVQSETRDPGPGREGDGDTGGCDGVI